MQRDSITICECFARDGLQHEPALIPQERKTELIDAFSTLGFPRIEVTSYSNPKLIPQFSDASALLRSITRKPGVFYKATCPNKRAVIRALEDLTHGNGANEISLLVSASESHTQKNLRTNREGQWRRVMEMVQEAGDNFRLIGSISVAFGCPFEGPVPLERVLDDVKQFASLGVHYVSFGDTTGLANPRSVAALFACVLDAVPGVTPIAHFHDTRGTGLANCLAAYQAGCRHFDSAFGGVGGHPTKIQYGSGHTGNVATEDLVNMFEGMGVSTGLNLESLVSTAMFCETVLERPLRGMVTRAGLARDILEQVQ